MKSCDGDLKFGENGLWWCPYCKKGENMTDLEKFLKGITDIFGDAWKEIKKPKITETDLGANKEQIQIELPEPPTIDTVAWGTYEDAMVNWHKECNVKICEAIPDGYSLKSSEVKEVIRHYADIVVEKS